MAPGRVQRQQAADTRACMRSCALLRSGHQSLELNQGPGGHWPGQCPHGQASNPAICSCYQGAPSSFSDFILCQATLEHAATSRAQAGSGMATDETEMATDGVQVLTRQRRISRPSAKADVTRWLAQGRRMQTLRTRMHALHFACTLAGFTPDELPGRLLLAADRSWTVWKPQRNQT